MNTQLNNPKVTRAWTMYDWANSVFSLTITTAIFPPYFESVSKAASIASGNFNHGVYFLDVFGFKIVNTALYTYAVSLGFLLVALFNPILSGIADARKSKKSFMKFFCYLGSLSCILMYFFDSEHMGLGLTCFVLALFGFGGSIVFYNAFLPEIATEDQFDSLSARGFSMGYIGSVLLLLIDLAVILNVSHIFPLADKAAELMSLDPGLNLDDAMLKAKSYYSGIASRLAFVSVGLWWAGFAQITFRNLPEKGQVQVEGENIFAKGLNELKKVWKEINKKGNGTIRTYLLGAFFSAMGVQTVMYVASIFGKQELNMELGKLIATVLIIQLIAILGAWGFSKISGMIGNIHTLLIMLVIWIGITTAAYYVKTEYQFYALAAVVGSVMGGIQSMLRSTFAKLIPDQTSETASYFSFYDISEKIATVLGTFAFGYINHVTENMRSSVLALIIFFILALIFIAQIKNFKRETSLMKVDLFIPCFVDQFSPQTGFNMVKVLEYYGCKVSYNTEQTCCGLPAFNAGHWEDAREIGEKLLNEVSNDKPLVCGAAACTAMIRNSYDLLFQNSSYHNKYRQLQKRNFELSEFLTDVLKVTESKARFEAKAVFIDSCQALHQCNIQQQPRKLLAMVEGLQLLEMQGADVCCGFGGTFSLNYTSMSVELAAQKVQNVMDTGADVLISTDYACLMHLDGYIKKQQLPLRVMHLADVLAEGW